MLAALNGADLGDRLRHGQGDAHGNPRPQPPVSSPCGRAASPRAYVISLLIAAAQGASRSNAATPPIRTGW